MLSRHSSPSIPRGLWGLRRILREGALVIQSKRARIFPSDQPTNQLTSALLFSLLAAEAEEWAGCAGSPPPLEQIMAKSSGQRLRCGMYHSPVNSVYITQTCFISAA